MKLETFFEKFDQFADAPGAVVKMRELLTHLAVVGRLVPNDSNEMPVELELSGASGEESSLPSNWRSGLLGEAFVFEYGDNLPATKRSQSGQYPVYGSNGIVGTHETYLTKEPAIIVGRKGSAGALNIATGPSWTTDVAYFVRPPKDLDLRFTYYLFSTLRLDELGKGIKPGLSRKEAYELPIALPPLAEQKRIVAKVDELMALCDQLEAQQQERETRHAALARASLACFADAPTTASLNFLFHDSYSIDPSNLRKSILTLAVQGKLVPQDPNDEPARLLLERIHVEKAQLVRDGVLKRAEQMSNESEGTPTFGLPDGWEFVSLSELCTSITDGDHLPPPKTETGIPFLVISNVRWGGIEFSDTRYVSEEYFGKLDPIRKPRKGDILYTLVGSFGIPVMVNVELPFCVQRHIGILRPSSEVSEAYLVYLLASEFVLEQSSRIATGIAQKTVPLGGLRRISVPLPPLAEQRRIVDKVDQLMVLVDALETQLATARATAEKLMEAVVAELTTQD
jgi:type I restriction enzyme S subunit